MPTAPLPIARDQSQTDAQHLKLLAIFHFVLAGLSLIGLGFLGLHWFIMESVLSNPEAWQQSNSGPPPEQFFALFKWFYLGMGVLVIASGLANLVSGFMIRQRRGRIFSLVNAGVNCLFFPFGTALGVFTFIVLLRDSVEALYAAPRPSV
jgi:hypothetical protein